MLRYNIDTTDYDVKIAFFNSGMENVAPQINSSSADIIEKNLIKNTPVKTGVLRGSIIKQVEKTSAVVMTTAGYGKFVDQDTKPHRIFGRPFLRFVINGTVFFRRFVDHPGTKGQQFKAKTVNESRDEINNSIVKIYKELTGSR